MKNQNLKFVIWAFFTASLYSCRQNIDVEYQKITGETMGTYYQIQYEYKVGVNLKTLVDSVLADFNQSLSTYIDNSTISKINQAQKAYCYSPKEDKYFLYSWKKAIELSKMTAGAFQPTVMPLVNYWGFGYGKREKINSPDQRKIDSLLQLVGTDKVSFDEKEDTICFYKKYPGVAIDLSASAKGHGVDVISELISGMGIKNYFVEIGGEIRASGVNARGEEWTVGVNRPSEDASKQEIEIVLHISDKSLATSGNYRNFYRTDQGKVSHIIDPTTGMARPTDVLSASVVAEDCLTADALATACMVLGWEKAAALIDEIDGAEVFLIFVKDGVEEPQYYFSDGFKNLVKQ